MVYLLCISENIQRCPLQPQFQRIPHCHTAGDLSGDPGRNQQRGIVFGYGRCPVYCAFPYGSERPYGFGVFFWAIGEGILCGASLLPLAILGCPIIGIFLLVFSNRQQADSPYLLIIRMDSVEGEKTVTTFVQQVVKRMTLKSKTITGGQGTELIFEICPKNGESAFVNEISRMAGVQSAVMVSYDGNYAA